MPSSEAQCGNKILIVRRIWNMGNADSNRNAQYANFMISKPNRFSKPVRFLVYGFVLQLMHYPIKKQQLYSVHDVFFCNIALS